MSQHRSPTSDILTEIYPQQCNNNWTNYANDHDKVLWKMKVLPSVPNSMVWTKGINSVLVLSPAMQWEAKKYFLYPNILYSCFYKKMSVSQAGLSD